MVLLSLCLLLGVAAAFQPEPKEHYQAGWVRGDRSPARAKLDLTLALTRDSGFLTDELLAVSLPLSPRYGRHWTQKQIQARFRPSADTLRKAKAWAKGNGIHCHLMDGHSDWMQCPRVPVRKLERMLKAKFYDFTHPKAPNTVLHRTPAYHLPDELAGVIDFVGGIKRLPDMRQVQRHVTARKENADGVTPTRTRQLFHVNVQGNTHNGNKQEIANFLQQYMSRDDLHQFWTDLSLPTTINVTIFGPNDPSNPGVEASLDIETITGVNQGTPTWFTVNPGLHDKQEPFLKWLLLIAGRKEHAWVHSVSYGDVEASLDLAFVSRVDEEFQKLGLTGHTFVYASGDSGVSCNNGNQDPDFPASSPHVLAVGGSVDDGSSSPVSWGGSGGGSSNVFRDPEFMQATHKAYLSDSSNNLPPSSTFNQTGRFYPDVGAIAMDVIVVAGGQEIVVGGTSCAAPATSAIVSLLNDVRIANGKPVLGYINPLIYSAAASGAFVGVTSGQPNSAGACQGFQAASSGGWAPICGFGGFNFEAMSKVVAALN